MDPQQRLLLEVGYSALREAGESRDSLMGAAIGVFVGVMSDGDWQQVQADKISAGAPMSAYAINGGGTAALSGRVSFVWGLKGPCISINTVCSASLVAVDSSAQASKQGRCSAALVIGTNLILHPGVFYGYMTGGALGPDGKCKTFDAAADGLGRGEACGAVVLESSSVDTSILQASLVNQDGRSASMTTPNGPSQAELLRAAIQQAGGDATRSFNETHGTGTPLGLTLSGCCSVMTEY